MNVYLTQFIFGIVELPAVLSGFILNQHLGRRISQAGFLLFGGAACLLVLAIPKGTVYPFLLRTPQSQVRTPELPFLTYFSINTNAYDCVTSFAWLQVIVWLSEREWFRWLRSGYTGVCLQSEQRERLAEVVKWKFLCRLPAAGQRGKETLWY